MLVRQKRNLEEHLIIIKVHMGLIEKKHELSQQRFHEHYQQCNHNGIDDWQFTLIEQSERYEKLKERETFFEHRFKTFNPYGLNEKEEYLY